MTLENEVIATGKTRAMRFIVFLFVICPFYCIGSAFESIEQTIRLDGVVIDIELLKNRRMGVLTKNSLNVVNAQHQLVSSHKFQNPIKSSLELASESLTGASLTYLESWDKLLICAQEWIRCKVVAVDSQGKLGSLEETDLQVYLSQVSGFVPAERKPADAQPIVFTQLFRNNPNLYSMEDSKYISIDGFDPNTPVNKNSLNVYFDLYPDHRSAYVQRTGLNYSMLPYAAAESHRENVKSMKVEEGSMKVLLSFTPGNGFVYFVRIMTKKEYFYDSNEGRTYRRLRVLRLCEDDSGPQLYSWTEMALVCGEDENTFMTQFETQVVTYDKKLNRLVTLSTNAAKNRLKTETRICSFKLDKIDEILTGSYNSCQNISLVQAREAYCSGPPSFNDWNCVWRHNTQGNTPNWCKPLLSEKFYTMIPYIDNAELQASLPKDRKPYPICDILYFDAHMFEFRLEQVRPLHGSLLSDNLIWDQDDMINKPQIGMEVHYASNHSFSIITWNSVGDIFRLVGAGANTITVQNSRKSHNNIASAAALRSNDLIFSDANQVFRFTVNCGSMYTTCKSVVDNYKYEPLKCVWCTKLDGSAPKSISEKDCKSDATLSFTSVCPPSLTKIEYREEANLLIFNSDNMHSMKSLGSTNNMLEVCGKLCKVQEKKSDYISCIPTVTDITQCRYLLYGTVENKPMNISGQVTDLLLGYNRSNVIPGSNLVAIAIGVLVCLIVLALLIFVLYRSRRRFGWCRSKKAASRLLHTGSTDSSTHFNIRLDPGNATAGYLNPRRGNSYDGTSHPPMVNYREILGELMKEVPDNLFLPHEKVTCSKLVGNGHYGVVYQGEYTHRDNTIESVAIKSVLDARNVEGVAEFLREGLRMEPFDHKHVLKLTGICFSDQGLPKIVTPFMNKGDLLNFIRKEENNEHCTLRGLIRFAAQVADGIAYLHDLKFVHRDLACRNCMLKDDLTVCIADFGLSRDVYEMQEYVVVHADRLLPIRWMALEVIYKESYTYKSDMWSYGVLVWEIITRGLIPYADMDSQQLAASLEKGQRLPKPQYCPDNIYDLMYACWQKDASLRPTAVHAFDQLTDLMNRSSIVDTNTVHSPSYYNVLPDKVTAV